MATTKLRIFLPPPSPVSEIQVKASDWDTVEILDNETLIVKLGSMVVASYARGQYVGFARFYSVV